MTKNMIRKLHGGVSRVDKALALNMIRGLYGGVSLVDKIIYFVFICILTHVSDRCDNYFFYDYEQVYDYEQ